MGIIKFIKDYWVLITFTFGAVSTFLVFIKDAIEAIKCSLRNDILSIYDRCKDKKQITHYQLEALHHSAERYFKFKGNSFVKDLIERVDEFEIVD